MEDKVSLIDSIFNHIEIGKFVFIVLSFEESDERGLRYEILDGKQRLSALCEFYEDRFKYKGKKYSELSFKDKNHFLGFEVAYGEVKDVTKQQIYKYFVKLNTTGKPVDLKHIEKVKSLIK